MYQTRCSVILTDMTITGEEKLYTRRPWLWMLLWFLAGLVLIVAVVLVAGAFNYTHGPVLQALRVVLFAVWAVGLVGGVAGLYRRHFSRHSSRSTSESR